MSDKIPDRKLTGILFNVGASIFLLLTTVAEAVYPNFSLQTNAISDLAATGANTAIIEGTAIIGLGLSWTVGAYYLNRTMKKRGMMILNLLPGIGALLAGLSPENVNIIFHSIGAFLAFVFGPVVVILSYKATRATIRYLSVGLGVLSLASAFVVFIGGQIVGPCGTCSSTVPQYTQRLQELGLGLGGWESMIIYPLIIWLIGYGNHLMTSTVPDSNR